MPATAHTIEIIFDGLETPVFVEPHDTVVWTALADTGSNVGSGVNTATITFTGSAPFTQSLSGSITLKGGQKSSTYTVSTTAKSGNYAYKVVVDGKHTYPAEIQVMSEGEIVINGGE